MVGVKSNVPVTGSIVIPGIGSCPVYPTSYQTGAQVGGGGVMVTARSASTNEKTMVLPLASVAPRLYDTGSPRHT